MHNDQQEDQPQTEHSAQPESTSSAESAESQRSDSVAAQIRRQLREESGEPEDKNFDFQMRLRAGGNELNDTAQEFTAASGEEHSPPEFDAGGWSEVAPAGGAALRWVVIGLAAAGLVTAAVLYGLPLLRDYQTQQAESKLDAQLDVRPPLQAVQLDQSLHAGLAQALGELEASWSAAGLQAYAYRYRLSEEVVANVSQKLIIDAVLGGPDAGKAAVSDPATLAPLTGWQGSLSAHPGVSATFHFTPSESANTPLSDEKYIRYGYDYGLEHMDQLQVVIDALNARGSYGRVLNENITDPPLKTSGGFTFISRGYGYLPIYKTDANGYIQMGSGSTLARMTPQEVSGYYLFLYLNEATQGLDLYSRAALDYYTNKIAPLPYDSGTERLRNVTLKPDGKPDGIACVVKNGKLLKDGEL